MKLTDADPSAWQYAKTAVFGEKEPDFPDKENQAPFLIKKSKKQKATPAAPPAGNQRPLP